MFYHKATVMGALVLKPRLWELYAPLRIPSKRKRLPLVKFWNCQRQNTCVLKNEETQNFRLKHAMARRFPIF
jgi:hypothetical protein